MAYSAVIVSGAGIGFQFDEQDINNKRAYNGLLWNSVLLIIEYFESNLARL